MIRDITERKAAQTQLERMAHHDLLTGLPNRMLFDDRFEVALAAARRHLAPLAVAYLDLDGFKRINDASGHDVGDSVLLSCAQRLTAAVARRRHCLAAAVATSSSSCWPRSKVPRGR